MDKVYTKTGDTGETSLIGGRLRKDNLRTETYGTCDELSANIGQLHALINDDATRVYYLQLATIMTDLFYLGSDLANITDYSKPFFTSLGAISQLEAWIDEMTVKLPELNHFVLPTGILSSTQSHIARTVCRRLERLMVTLINEQQLEANHLVYINRLSDYLFTLARTLNHLANVKELEV